MSIFNSFVSGDVTPATGSTAEYGICMTAALESLNEMNDAVNEAHKSEFQSESLERLADICDNIPEASMGHLALFEHSMEALLGTAGVAVEDVMETSLESFEGKSISTERIRQIAKSAWEWIKKQLDRAWKAMSDFFHSIFGATTRIRKAAERLIERANGVSGKQLKESKIEVGSEINPLTDAEGKVIDKVTDIISGMSVGVDFLADMNQNYFGELAKLGDKLASNIGKFDGEKSNESLLSLVSEVEGSKMSEVLTKAARSWKPLQGSEKRYPNKSVVAESFIGGDVIALVRSRATAGDQTATVKAEQIRASQIVVIRGKDKMPDAIKEAKISTWTQDQCVEFANKVIEAVDAIEEYQRKGHQDKLKKSGDKLKAASDKLGKIEKDFTVDEDSQVNASQARTEMRSALYFNTAYQNWIQNPQTGVIRNLMAAARAGMSVANKSLSQYQ